MGFVENVNKLATDLTPAMISGIAEVVAHGDELETLHNNIADVNAIVDTIIPNMVEILAADTNAAIATTQAGIATAKADEAIAAANTAVLSEATVAYMLDTFDDRYLGQKSTDPVVDNDGNALLVGALYFNTVSNQMRVWDGTVWTDSLTLTAGSVSVLTNKTIDAMTNTVGADHVHYKCRNVSGSTIAKGVVVAAQGTQSGTDYIEIVPVTDPQTQIALGVAHVSIANNGTGLVLNTGVEEDRNTSAWTVGTILYPNTTGGFTSTKPTTGKYQACAIVLRQHTNQGTLLCEFTEPKYIASTTQAGYVQLNNTLTSTSTTEALTAAQGKVLQDGKQPLDATLTALAGVTTTADKYIYATASDTFTTGTITSFGRSLVDDADAATARGTLGISATNTPSTAVGGISATNVQGALQELDSKKMSTTEYLTAVGTINNPLLHMPLMNDIDLYKGVGTSTFTRASTATYVDRYGVLKTATIDEPRFELHGYLNEGDSTNLHLHGNFDSGWSTSRLTVTYNSALGPDGVSTNAATFTSDGSGLGYCFIKNNPVAGTVYTSSYFYKAGTYLGNIRVYHHLESFTSSTYIEVTKDGEFVVNTNPAIITSYNIQKLANSWIRISITSTATVTGNDKYFSLLWTAATPLANETFYAFGAQLEALPFATSYIPTTSATVTRAADVLNVTKAGNVPNLEKNGVISAVFDFDFLGVIPSANAWIWGIYQSSTDNIGAYVSTSKYLRSIVNSTTDANSVTDTTNSVERVKYRAVQVVDNSGNNLYVNGAFKVSDTDEDDSISSTLNTNVASIRIGSYDPTNTANVALLFGHISNFRIYDTALTSQEVVLV